MRYCNAIKSLLLRKITTKIRYHRFRRGGVDFSLNLPAYWNASLRERKTTMHSLSIPLGFALLSVFLLGLIRPERARIGVLPTDKASSDDGPRVAIERYFAAHALGKSEFITQA